jgi:hypothetical protein
VDERDEETMLDSTVTLSITFCTVHISQERKRINLEMHSIFFCEISISNRSKVHNLSLNFSSMSCRLGPYPHKTENQHTNPKLSLNAGLIMT